MMLRGARRRRGPDSRERKQELRAVALRVRRSIDPEALRALSSMVEENVVSLGEYLDARLIISYCAKPDEVQTKHLIERALAGGKRVAVVVTDLPSKSLRFSEIESFEDELAPGQFGILEPRPGHLRPVDISAADLIVVPLVAWDEEGRRLGYGAGYFDRALARAKEVPKVGLALESQRFPKIPESRYDVPLDVIVTEKRVVRPREKAFKNRGSRSR